MSNRLAYISPDRSALNPWRRPSGRVELDSGHDLFGRIVSAVYFDTPNVAVDLTGRLTFSSGAAPHNATPQGTLPEWNGSGSGTILKTANQAIFGSFAQLTALCRIRCDDKVNYRSPVRKANEFIPCQIGTTGIRSALWFGGATATERTITANISYTDGQPFDWAVSAFQGTDGCKQYKDGVLAQTTSTIGSGNFYGDASTPLLFGGAETGTEIHDGSLAYVVFVQGILSPERIADFQRAPYQLVRPATARSYSFPLVAGGTTYDLAAALAASPALAAALGVAGEDSAALDAAGALTAAGEAVAEGGVALAAAGAVTAANAVTKEDSAALAASAGLSAAATASVEAVASLQAGAGQSAVAALTIEAAAVLPAGSAVTAAGGLLLAADATLAAGAGVSVAGGLALESALALAIGAGQSAAMTLTLNPAANLAVAGGATATAQLSAEAQLALGIDAAMAVIAAALVEAGLSLDAVSDISIEGSVLSVSIGDWLVATTIRVQPAMQFTRVRVQPALRMTRSRLRQKGST